MIDLHLHTTASDGQLTPSALVARAAQAGLTVISVTDHDTVGGLADAAAAARGAGVTVVPGIEITAVEHERDVHVLGYFIDPETPSLAAFLRDQRADRVRRVREMAGVLGSLGYPVDVDALVEASAGGTRSIGRPALAAALVAAGYVASRDEAFDRLLARGRPAFVPRHGAGGADVVRVIHDAGGIAALAHPGLLGADDLIPALADAGLDALEVRHSDHSSADEARYRALAARYALERSGGSDFHGDTVHETCRLGAIAVPQADYDALAARATRRR